MDSERGVAVQRPGGRGMDHRDRTRPGPPGQRTAYEEVLRAIGRRLDREGWRWVNITEQVDAVLVSGLRTGDHGPEPVALRLTVADLRRAVAEARGQRRAGAEQDIAALAARLAVGFRQAAEPTGAATQGRDMAAGSATKDRDRAALRQRAELAEFERDVWRARAIEAEAALRATGTSDAGAVSWRGLWQALRGD